jgi:hypothetical protein
VQQALHWLSTHKALVAAILMGVSAGIGHVTGAVAPEAATVLNAIGIVCASLSEGLSTPAPASTAPSK